MTLEVDTPSLRSVAGELDRAGQAIATAGQDVAGVGDPVDGDVKAGLDAVTVAWSAAIGVLGEDVGFLSAQVQAAADVGNNLVDDAPILDLDPMRLTHDDLSGNGVTFASGGTRGGPGVVLADIGGWEERQPGLALSSHEWYEQEGQAVEYRQVGRHVVAVPVRVDPDRSLAGTAAGSWADYEDRMWHIHRMFEQMHTSPELFDTRPIDDEIDNRYLTGAVPLDLTGR